MIKIKNNLCECGHKKGSHNSNEKGYHYCRIRGCLCKKFKSKKKKELFG